MKKKIDYSREFKNSVHKDAHRFAESFDHYVENMQLKSYTNLPTWKRKRNRVMKKVYYWYIKYLFLEWFDLKFIGRIAKKWSK